MEEGKSPCNLGTLTRDGALRISLELREAKLQERWSQSSQNIASFGLPTGVN
ncbi:hypothetical protein MPNT_680005 [Candidatus Methylacidithermus pantelleriae]|uniref:Uncharacterized protein n=1 Tax=Candidatus Methylacidithermus pantelleriae TaxID=2744239 RepID=A0A8J2FUQ3_9BACT|nr:hypothetical protein MPNT_680005 [Candidatus Methylacidithermus pantelleriae]